jgi:hypothetical protein
MKRLLILISILALSVSGVALGAAKGKGKKTSGVAYAGISHVEGKDVYVSGDFKDKRLGRGGIVFLTNVSSTSTAGEYHVGAKKITLYTTRGSFTGSGQATQVIHDDGSSDVKDGVFSLPKGTGAYKGHRLTGKFSGPLQNGVYKFSYTARLK